MQNNYITAEHVRAMSPEQKLALSNDLNKAIVRSVLVFVAVKVSLAVTIRLIAKALDK